MPENSSIIKSILDYSSGTYRPEEYPALAMQTREWQSLQPLHGIRIYGRRL